MVHIPIITNHTHDSEEEECKDIIDLKKGHGPSYSQTSNQPVTSKTSQQFGDVKSAHNMEQGEGIIVSSPFGSQPGDDHEQIVVSLQPDESFHKNAKEIQS